MASSRKKVLSLVLSQNYFSWIHFLGFTFPEELVYLPSLNISNTKLSMDTGAPVLYAYKSLPLDSKYSLKKERPTWEQMKLEESLALLSREKVLKLTYYNIALLRKVLSNYSPPTIQVGG
jgi:hypothetical protein